MTEGSRGTSVEDTGKRKKWTVKSLSRKKGCTVGDDGGEGL